MTTTHEHTPPSGQAAVFVEAVAALDRERLAFLNEALIASAAIEAAERLGIFARLAAGPVTPSTLAQECAIGERGASLLLAALASLGLTDVTAAGAYRLTMSSPARLTARFTNLAQVIRDDHPSVSADTPSGAEALYPDATPVLGAMLASAAKEAAEYLTAPGLRPHMSYPRPGLAGCVAHNATCCGGCRPRGPVRLPQRRSVHYRLGRQRL
jgi:Dimerisation domain